MCAPARSNGNWLTSHADARDRKARGEQTGRAGAHSGSPTKARRASAAGVGGIGADYLCTREGKVEGFDFLMSALCDAKKLYFGNWSEMMMCFWSGIDMIVDPYTYSSKGAWQVTAFQDCDVIVRHPEAFAIGKALA